MKKILFLAITGLLTLSQSHAQLTVSTSPQNRGVLIESFMGIAAGYCPDASRRADSIRGLNPNVSFVEFHEGFYAVPGPGQIDLRTTQGAAILAATSIVGYPTGSVNRKLFPGETRRLVSRGDWLNYSNTESSSLSPVNIAADGYYDPVTGKLNVNVAMYYTSTVTTPHYLNVFLVQDSIVGHQIVYTPYPARTVPGGYLHNDVFREALTGTWGQRITGTTASNQVNRSFVYTPKTINGIPFVAKDMKIIAFITTNNGWDDIVTATSDKDMNTSAGPLPNTLSISGLTMMGGDTALNDSRVVYLIAQDTNVSVPALVLVDSVVTTGSYSFNNLSAGTYYLKSALLPGPNYANYIPSYHWQQTIWSNADSIVLTNTSVVGKFIDLIRGINPGGPGFVGGLVSNGANFAAGDPMKDVTVILSDTNGTPLAYDITDADGKYGFNDVAVGWYEVQLDVLNKKSVARRVEVTMDDPIQDDNDFTVGSKDIIVTGIEDADEFRGFSVYPNPSEGELFVEFESNSNNQFDVEVVNILGKTIYSSTFGAIRGKNQLQLSDLNATPGVYYLRINNETQDLTEKIVIR